jgi:hypothetical protein
MWTIVAVLLILWLLGLLTSMTLSGWIHLLPILAIAWVVMTMFSRRKRRYTRYR